MSVKNAARAKKTNAMGDERPFAELLGAVVEVAAPVEDVVFDEVDEEPVEEVLEADDVEEPVEEVEEPVEVVDEPDDVEVEEPVDEEPEVVDAEEDELLVAPPISWNWGL